MISASSVELSCFFSSPLRRFCVKIESTKLCEFCKNKKRSQNIFIVYFQWMYDFLTGTLFFNLFLIRCLRYTILTMNVGAWIYKRSCVLLSFLYVHLSLQSYQTTFRFSSGKISHGSRNDFRKSCYKHP